MLIKVAALAFVVSVVPAAAQESTLSNTAQTQTDPTNKPAGDATTNSMVPYGVNPPIPNTATPEATDTVRPETTGEKTSVPQGNFVSDKPNTTVNATETK